MLKVLSAGILLFREQPEKSFLLLRSRTRWDVPKGHVEKGESETEAALRELFEETGIPAEAVTLDPDFRFETNLKFKAAYMGGKFIDKDYHVFLGSLRGDAEIRLAEHDAFEWFAWNPPHHIQKWLIDPLLESVAQHFERQSE